MTIDSQIRAVQAKLGVVVDGIAGPITWRAIYDRIVGVAPPVVFNDSRVGERSEVLIATLLPQVRPYARALVNAAANIGITIHVTSGFRTYEEQDALYEQGRSRPGTVVTNARGGYSAHNFGIAFDVTVFQGASPKWEGQEYTTIGQIGKEFGLSWGGDFSSPDQPHFCLRPDWARGLSEADMMSGLRQRKRDNQPIYS